MTPPRIADPGAHLTRIAPAKINLALHVVGRRADGYHMLDSLVGFAAFGDAVALAPADALSLSIDGPFAAGLDAGPGNLVLRAAHALADWAAKAGHRTGGAALSLRKELPVASGIGGGSADAAATLRLLAEHWALPIGAQDLATLGLGLGADVPMCLAGTPVRVRGIGETILPVPALPPCGLVLVNPGCALATPDVFRGLERRDNPELPDLRDHWRDARDLADWLAGTRNDLSAPAIRLRPVIAEVLDRLAAMAGVRFARMSGSGATCFALTDDLGTAEDVARTIARLRPDWWIRATTLGAGEV